MPPKRRKPKNDSRPAPFGPARSGRPLGRLCFPPSRQGGGSSGKAGKASRGKENRADPWREQGNKLKKSPRDGTAGYPPLGLLICISLFDFFFESLMRDAVGAGEGRGADGMLNRSRKPGRARCGDRPGLLGIPTPPASILAASARRRANRAWLGRPRRGSARCGSFPAGAPAHE